jgi:hypothetical protein
VGGEQYKDIRVNRQKELLNEFRENNELLYQAFPHVFLLGEGLHNRGTMSETQAKHLFQQFTCAAAHEPRLVFLLFNQSQRHAAVTDVNATIKNHPTAFDACRTFISNPHFRDLCEKADANPKGPEAKEILKTIGKFITITGSKVGGHVQSCCVSAGARISLCGNRILCLCRYRSGQESSNLQKVASMLLLESMVFSPCS